MASSMTVSDRMAMGLKSTRRRSAPFENGRRAMIEVYSWATPNGHKVHVMLEECGLAYRAIPVNIGAGDQFKP